MFLWYDTDRIEKDMSNNSSIFAYAFVAAVGFLPIRYLATIWGRIQRHTDRWEGLMKCIIKMGSVAIIYTPSFIKISSGIQTLMEGTT
jgi:hypothetical protein